MDNARKQSELLCLVVGEVPNSSSMLRFKQKHVCLSISSKPVDMPEDRPQSPQHPPRVTHRPDGAWRNLTKEKGTDEMSTAK